MLLLPTFAQTWQDIYFRDTTSLLKLFSRPPTSSRFDVLLCSEIMCIQLSQYNYLFPFFMHLAIKKYTPSAFNSAAPTSLKKDWTHLWWNNNNYIMLQWICTVQVTHSKDAEANLVESGRNLSHLVDGDACSAEPETLSVLCIYSWKQ